MAGDPKTMAVCIAEIPSFLQVPRFIDPHAQIKYLTQQFPDQWVNFTDLLERQGHCSAKTARTLQSLRFDQIEPKERGVLAQLNEWMDLHMPTFKRTCIALCEARDRLKAGNVAEGFTVNQIFWPKIIRENDAANIAAAQMKIQVIPHDVQSKSFDYLRLLDKPPSDFLWVIPGGLKLNLYRLLINEIKIVLRQFEAQVSAAAYYDRHSTIYRSSALREILKYQNPLPTNREKQVQLMLGKGYSILGHPHGEPSFSSIEKIYLSDGPS